MHAEIVLKEDVNDYAPLFGEIADAYFDRALYPEAGQIYETLGGDPEVKCLHLVQGRRSQNPDLQTSSIHVLMQAAACRHMVGDIKEAAEVYEHGAWHEISRVICNLTSTFHI